MSKIAKRNQRPGIGTWRRFGREIRPRGCRLLKELDAFSDSVLVAGCQRSGTTMLARIITSSEGMTNYWVGADDELDAALVLSGHITLSRGCRYCFQTTYLNECYREYYQHRGQYKLIWVLRNPYSVVYSLVHNWSGFALNELFRGCGAPLLEGVDKSRYKRFGVWAISRLRRACFSYNGKITQMIELSENLGEHELLMVDYDDLVTDRNRVLPTIYDFIDLPYKEEYGSSIHPNSVSKAVRLTERERSVVRELCGETYANARLLTSHSGA